MAAFIADQRTEHGIPHAMACRALGVSQSWFYKWRDRPASARREGGRSGLADADQGALRGLRRHLRLTEDLHRADESRLAGVGEHRREDHGRTRPGRPEVRRRGGLTRPGKTALRPRTLSAGTSRAEEPDLVWAGDMTEIVTGEGKLYLATVIDLFSRRLLGYAMGAHHDAELVVASLNMAAATRGGDVDGVIFHSDRGSE